MLCTVSYWNCYIVLEADGRYPLGEEDIHNEYSHTGIIDFCKYLYADVSRDVDEWASFVDYFDEDEGKKSRRFF